MSWFIAFLPVFSLVGTPFCLASVFFKKHTGSYVKLYSHLTYRQGGHMCRFAWDSPGLH